ncbi:MAG: helicase, partial [Myxococcales bacterium]|nr:helicase [Myxococcales bacterium]
TAADATVEHLLGLRRDGMVPTGLMMRLLGALATAQDVKLDGVVISVDRRPVLPIVRVTGTRGRYVTRLEQDSTITEVFGNGAVLSGTTLAPLGQIELSYKDVTALREGKRIEPNQLSVFVTETLPEYRKKFNVVIEAPDLPKLTTAAPRLEIQVSRDGDTLAALPLILYGDPAIARVDGESLTLLRDEAPLRDVSQEKRLTQQCLEQLGVLPGRKISAQGSRAMSLATRLRGLQKGVQGTAHQDFYLTGDLHVNIDFPNTNSNGLTIQFFAEKEQSKQHATVQSVLRAWQSGLAVAPLEGGGFATLPMEWLNQYGQILADLVAAKALGERDPPPFATLDITRLCQAAGVAPPPSFAKLRGLLDEFEAIPQANLPADLYVDLRAYQRKGVDWLSFLRSVHLGGLLADDMGLGKTVQALCVVDGRTLVVAPTSVLFNWAAEIRRFRPSMSVSTYHGPQRRLDSTANITLTSYAVMRLDIAELEQIDWDTIILDEAQAIKNSDSQVAQAAHRLRGKFRIALTGTPVENRLEELWSQFQFLNPGLLGERADFQARYASPIASGDIVATARLRERLKPFILRRHKRDVAPELPPRLDRVLDFDLSDEERVIYQAIQAAGRAEIMEKLATGSGVMQALELLLRLRQAACHPALLPGRSESKSSKVELLVDQLSQIASEGHKALVFSQWTSLLDLIEPRLVEENLTWLRLDGSTRDREGVVRDYQRDDGPPILLLSLRAGGTGVNLTAADHVFLMDPWWNPAVEEQAADRAHRIGQTRPVLVHRLVARNTVEERIRLLQDHKRNLADAAIGGDLSVGGLTRDDLMLLLGDDM